MAVKEVVNNDGTISFYAYYRGPRGYSFQWDKVAVLKPGALERDRRKARNDAEKECIKQLALIRSGTWIPKKQRDAADISLHELFDKFIKEYPSKNGRMDRYTMMIPVFKRSLPDIPLKDVQPVIFLKFRKKRSEEIYVPPMRVRTKPDEAQHKKKGTKRVVPASRKIAPGTINNNLRALTTMFNWAITNGWYTGENPVGAKKVPRLQEPPAMDRYLTKEEQIVVINNCPTWAKLPIRWALATGMDRGEITRLTWTMINQRVGIVLAPRRKTNKKRSIPMNQEMRNILDAAKNRAASISGSSPDFVFLNKTGKQIKDTHLDTVIERAYQMYIP